MTQDHVIKLEMTQWNTRTHEESESEGGRPGEAETERARERERARVRERDGVTERKRIEGERVPAIADLKAP